MMKLKFIAILLIFSQSLFFSACGGGGGDDASDDTSTSTSTSTLTSTATETSTSTSTSTSTATDTSTGTSTSTSTSTETDTGVEKVVAWRLNPGSSRLNFLSTKKIHIVETHHFDTLSGFIYDDNTAVLTIDLSSVNTDIDIRDTRMKDVLFEVLSFPLATAENSLNLASIEAMSAGSKQIQTITTSLMMHGLSTQIDSNLIIHKVSSDKIIVRSQKPLLINALDFGFAAGIDELKTLASLTSISTAVPVDFLLVFTRG
ncbi:MAG: YceI family protein [Pseudomonadales bacterium]|nr:YceI family protein [Pseudomonadales bacterium]